MKTENTENSTKHILLIEDNPDHALLAKKSLERSGHLEVLVSETGSDGLMKLKSEHFDLVISDYLLPDISGLELLRHAKNENHLRAGFY